MEHLLAPIGCIILGLLGVVGGWFGLTVDLADDMEELVFRFMGTLCLLIGIGAIIVGGLRVIAQLG